MKGRDKDAIIVIVAGLVVLYLLYGIKMLLITALLISLLSIVSDKVTSYISKAWYGLAMVIGTVTNKILLSAVYFLLLTPIAVLKRITGNGRMKKNENSFYTDRNHTVKAEDFKKQW